MPSQSSWQDTYHASLAERYEQLHRTSRAMWRLLKAKLHLNDAELCYTLARIEHETQAPTSVPARRLIDCSICRHPLQNTAKCCLYCGTAPLVELRSINPTSKPHIQQ